jgi:pimeloyl-ACP methyl ester carboxylesterase
MDELKPEDLDAQAEALLLRMTRARRRERPRVAEALRRAEDREIETPYGGVIAWRLGEGPAVLMVHGWEDDNALWGPLIEEFAAIGRAVVAFDLPGHGYSPAEEATIGSASAAIRAVADAFGPIDAVIGHSFGCPSIIRAMDEGFEAPRAVLIASPIPGRQYGKRGGGAPEDVWKRAYDLHLERTGEHFLPYDITEAAAKMRAKALFVHSMDDEECPPSNAQTLADLWPGAELAWTDGLGHRMVAQDPEVMRRIVDFVEGFG